MNDSEDVLWGYSSKELGIAGLAALGVSGITFLLLRKLSVPREVREFRRLSPAPFRDPFEGIGTLRAPYVGRSDLERWVKLPKAERYYED